MEQERQREEVRQQTADIKFKDWVMVFGAAPPLPRRKLWRRLVQRRPLDFTSLEMLWHGCRQAEMRRQEAEAGM